MLNPLYGKSVLDLTELSQEDLLSIIELAVAMKLKPENYRGSLAGKILVMIFEKNSTRTRVSFEAGIIQLGGQAIVLDYKSTQMGRGEKISDTAKVLSGYADAIMIRAYSDEMVSELAKEAMIPVINGLTDHHHPCQILADFLTIYEQKGKLKGLKLAYVGDGNNMGHSFLIGGSLTGMDVSIASPVGYEVKQSIFECAKKNANKSGSKIQLLTDPNLAVKDADIIVTDVWASMGEEHEQKEREEAFKNFQVNNRLSEQAKKDYLFLHCLPAHRGEEVTTDIIDGPHSVVFQEAENRLHAQKALMTKLMKQ